MLSGNAICVVGWVIVVRVSLCRVFVGGFGVALAVVVCFACVVTWLVWCLACGWCCSC